MTRRRLRSLLLVLAALGLPGCASDPVPVPAPVVQPVAQQPAGVPQARFIRVPLIESAGVHYVNVGIDEVCCLSFVLDSGAADVSVSIRMFQAMVKGKRITEDDIIDVQKYRTASGAVIKGLRFRLRTMTIGGHAVHNVVASVSEGTGDYSMLLGQTFLQKFAGWSVNNATGELILKVN